MDSYVSPKKVVIHPNSLRNLRRIGSGKDNPNFGKRGEGTTSWKSGKTTSSSGYIRVRNQDHPFNDNGYILEHRLVMEKELGRYLQSWELVHHKNGVRTDNRVENLIMVTREKHKGIVLCPHCNKQFAIE